MELRYVFTRRAPQEIKLKDPSVKVLSVSEAEKMKDEIDVMILCGGSATDLPEQGPVFAGMFNTVDSFESTLEFPNTLKKLIGIKSSRKNRSYFSRLGSRFIFNE
jgi:diaminopimelate dehydrogenase